MIKHVCDKCQQVMVREQTVTITIAAPYTNIELCTVCAQAIFASLKDHELISASIMQANPASL